MNRYVDRSLRDLAALPADPALFSEADAAVYRSARATAVDEIGRLDRSAAEKAERDRARSERQVERGEANTRTREGNRRPRPRQRRQDPPALVAGKREVHARSGGYCEAQTSVCDRQAVHVHHIAGRVGKHAHEAVNLLDVCGPCHDYVHAHPEESRERGWMRSRIASTVPEGTEA